MNRGGAPNQRDLLLRKLLRRKFARAHVGGADALVAFVPNQGECDAAIRERLKLPFEHRWYPTESGHLVKWPYEGEPFDPQQFRVEERGWDHEHCSACQASLGTNVNCWITKRGSFFVL
jgi:hypothetical protein